MKPAIKIEHLSKRYRIGGLHPGYMTFRELIGSLVTAPFRKLKGSNGRQTLWALNDVNLRNRTGRACRHHRSQRRGQIDAAENSVARDQTDHR